MGIPEFIRKEDFIACFSRFAKEFGIYGNGFRIALLNAFHKLKHERYVYYKCHVHNLVADVLSNIDLEIEEIGLLGEFWNEYSSIEYGYSKCTKVYVT